MIFLFTLNLPVAYLKFSCYTFLIHHFRTQFPENVFILRTEDMDRDPVSVTSKLMSFLELGTNYGQFKMKYIKTNQKLQVVANENKPRAVYGQYV